MGIAKTNSLDRHQFPSFQRIEGFKVDLNNLQASYNEIRSEAQKNGGIYDFLGNEIIDLTYVDPNNLRFKETSFLGINSERLYDSDRRPQDYNINKTLDPNLITNPMLDDRNHLNFKEWVPNNYLISLIKSFGDISKVSLATLSPNSWWPPHYDFDLNHTCKINIPIFTNDKVFSLSWRPRESKLEECQMKAGEIWWINTALKHTAVNWGDSPRTFLLVTFQSLNFFNKNILKEN